MKKILVIEDEELVRSNLCDFLELEGYQVKASADGEEGVGAAREFLPDVILCDIMMPGLDGYAVLEKLQAAPETKLIPFIFLTARTERHDQRTGMDRGADDYLMKPFTQAEVLSAIEARLRKRQGTQQYVNQEIETARETEASSVLSSLLMPRDADTGCSEVPSAVAPPTRANVAELAREAHSASRRLRQAMLRDLLEWAQANPNRIESLKQQGLTSARAIIMVMSSRLAADAGRQRDLFMDVEDALLPMAPAHFRNVVEELVSNALTSSHCGDTVLVSGQHLAHCYELSIVRQGRRVEREQAVCARSPSVFERPADDLCLDLVKRVIELHGGELRTSYSPQSITKVVVCIPFSPAEASDLERTDGR